MIIVAAAFLLIVAASACGNPPADVVSSNISKEADRFNVMRRIVFINGITDKYLLVIEGKCSLGNNDDPGELTVTCKIGPNAYTKHFLGLSDNVTYMVEQLETIDVSEYHYKVIYRPSTLIPSVELDTP
jgi:hypothetical protein